ncbi:hypothetical protein E2C01_081688 [Portunus trituberculatus]|uniref:Uncharacterized protein n=1 Tax=Portunus trituberculatus TaxID=210409 RepID=A0A5B7IN36_PORTR|nr:hypothetical protein [Portunus trituberculatus]
MSGKGEGVRFRVLYDEIHLPLAPPPQPPLHQLPHHHQRHLHKIYPRMTSAYLYLASPPPSPPPPLPPPPLHMLIPASAPPANHFILSLPHRTPGTRHIHTQTPRNFDTLQHLRNNTLLYTLSTP